MPANPKIYGRDEYVSTAVLLVLSGNTTRLAILGPGGMGKTSVALKIVYDPKIVAYFVKNIHWTPCEQATSIPLLIELLAKTLHLPTSSSHDRFEEVILALENSTSVHLLLLDNFETPWDIPGKQSEVADILARLASIPSVSIILTMRGSLPPASDMVEWSKLPSLTQLDLAAAREAFLRLCPGAADDEELDTLLIELDCMPLAITLMAKLGQGGESPSDLLLQWRSERTGLLSQPGGDRRNSIDVSIKLSLDSHLMRATPDAVRLLSVLAMLPAGGCVARIPSMCPSISSWKKTLRILHNAALTYDGPNKTLVHVLSPIRSYILLHHSLDETGWRDLRTSYCQLAAKGKSQPGDPLYFDNLKELTQEQVNLETVLISSLKRGVVEQAVVQACLDYSNHCYWTQQQPTVIAATVDAVRISRPELLARCLLSYGSMLHMQDRRNEAIPILEEARAEYTALGKKIGAGRCFQTLGDIHYLQTNYDKARQALKEAKSIFVSLDVQIRVAHCLLSLGKVYMAEGRYDEARSSLEDARAKFQAENSQVGGAQCLWLLGKLLSIEGEHGQARSLLEEARALSLSHGDQLCATQCLQELARVLYLEESYDEAIPLFEQAKARFLALNSQFGVAQCLESLGRIYHKQGKHDDAVALVEEARVIFDRIGHQAGTRTSLELLKYISKDVS
ncbi:hypothetical protein FRC02_003438 [Tulasnella sp. 418]|nr:hypothetical protein FRC02_003438 [Tulasnella sp. 418]